MLDNLSSNALRHTPRWGRVTVAAARRDEVGPHLFERYRQGPGERRGSVGLGLPIARGIVRAHGGELDVESRPGAGAEFRFTIPGEAP